MPATEASALRGLSPVENSAEDLIEMSVPYRAIVEVTGVSVLLFHRYNVESVAEKAAAKKGSAQKKTDDIETYVYRLPNGHLALPGSYMRGAIVNAAKYRQDPRSPRKSAMDLYKAGVQALTELADLGVKDWSFVHQGRVLVQKNAITRNRPALNAGWKCEFEMLVTLPEYIPPQTLNETIQQAGRLIGLADYRPTYGRFNVTRFRVTAEA